ncbi:MAG: ORF6N domain-containing protein [Candidatus Omnitrophica bacterium]|nr:ORF6N domain-containing protein [Candidatus Omnitrophota bacterium]
MKTRKTDVKTTLDEKIIERRIFIIRGKKIMLGHDLAELYGVETRTLNQAVKRNLERFPQDFMFQLTHEEKSKVITICDNLPNVKFSPVNPYVFTEHGILMLSSVLNSRRAILVNIQIMRTFTKLREMLASHVGLKRKIEEMEKKYNYQFKVVFEAIKKLLDPPEKPKGLIGFHVK